MGSGASKLAVQERFLDLSRTADVAKDDGIWDSLFSAAAAGTHTSDAEFFAIVSPDLIRRIRDVQPQNFELLLSKMAERLDGLVRIRAIGTNGTVGPQISNMCRIITRVYPIVYERALVDSEYWAEQYVWKQTDIGQRTVVALRELLLFPGYTVPLSSARARNQVLWAGGIGSSDAAPAGFVQQRTDVVRAILSVLSQPMYSSVGTTGSETMLVNYRRDSASAPSGTLLNETPRSETPRSDTGDRTPSDRAEMARSSFGLDFWTATTDQPAVFCSIMNIALASEPFAWGSDAESKLAELSLELMLVSVTHVHSNDGTNKVRKMLSRLHRPADLNWLTERLIARISHQNDIDTDVLGISIVWELLQANSKFTREPALAEVVKPLLRLAQTHGKQDLEARARLALFALLTLSAACSGRAAEIGPGALEILWRSYRRELRAAVPRVETLTLVDILWNAAPSQYLTSEESDELMSLNEAAENPEVRKVLAEIKERGGTGWKAVPFVWTLARLRWYVGIIWGQAYKTSPRVWSHSGVTLFHVAVTANKAYARSPEGAVDAAGDAALTFVKSAATKFLSRE